MLGFSCADFVIVVKISRVGFTENCGVNAGHSQLYVSIRRFEFSRSNELYFDIYLTDFVILSMHIASIRSLFKMPHRSTTFACISLNLTFVMAVFFLSAVGFLFSVMSTLQPRWKFVRLVYVGFNKG